MILNRVEYFLMNNPIRAAIQRRFEADWFLRKGGAMSGGTALEIGCGRGVGIELILDVFGADRVDGCDLDPRMLALARKRLIGRRSQVYLSVSDATAIPAPDATYDAVFDFGIIHHIPSWRSALTEIHRVLKPGGCFFAEEMLRGFITNPVTRLLLAHPLTDRFDAHEFGRALENSGFRLVASQQLVQCCARFVGTKVR